MKELFMTISNFIKECRLFHLCLWAFTISSGICYKFNITSVYLIYFTYGVVFTILEMILANSTWYDTKIIDFCKNLGNDEKLIIYNQFMKPNNKTAMINMNDIGSLSPILGVAIPAVSNGLNTKCYIQLVAWRYFKKYPRVLEINKTG